MLDDKKILELVATNKEKMAIKVRKDRRELTGLIQTVEGLPELPTVWTL